ncbi:MAG: type II and III secretion system protein [bacterium]|nr:type II and III secretion system protein [bacterium]
MMQRLSHRKRFVWSGLLLAGMLWSGLADLVWAQSPQRMVEIQATIYEYRFSNEKQLGIFYQFNRIKGSWQNSDIYLHGTESTTNAAIPALDLSGSFGRVAYGSIDYNIKTAIEEGRATIISNPTVLTTDGQKSSLSSGERVPLTKLQMQGTKTVLQLEFRDTGIKFNVTPRIFRSNYVILNMEIESSEITGFQIFDRGDRERFELPIITTRTIQNAVILPSGSTLYVGGLYTRSTGDITRKIPVLGDLPGVGFFLRGFNKSKQNTETIFKITPIIRSPGDGLDPSYQSSIFGDLLKKTDDTAIVDEVEPVEGQPAANGSHIVSPTDILEETKSRVESQAAPPPASATPEAAPAEATPEAAPAPAAAPAETPPATATTG